MVGRLADVCGHSVLPGLFGVVGELDGVVLGGLGGFASGDDGVVDGFLCGFVGHEVADAILE